MAGRSGCCPPDPHNEEASSCELQTVLPYDAASRAWSPAPRCQRRSVHAVNSNSRPNLRTLELIQLALELSHDEIASTMRGDNTLFAFLKRNRQSLDYVRLNDIKPMIQGLARR
jgi:hypothetical protein